MKGVPKVYTGRFIPLKSYPWGSKGPSYNLQPISSYPWSTLKLSQRPIAKSILSQARDSFLITKALTSPSIFKNKRGLAPANLVYLEDRRRWHPEGVYAPAGAYVPSHGDVVERDKEWQERERFIRKQIEKLKRVSQPGYNPFNIRMTFRRPSSVAICLRRWIRRQMMFVTGRAGTKVRKPRWNAYSWVRC